MARFCAVVALSLLLFASCYFCSAQDNVGLPPFAALHSGVYDTVKLSTGTIRPEPPRRLYSILTPSLPRSRTAPCMFQAAAVPVPSSVG